MEGLLVDFVMECNATIVVRGLRAVTDFEYELQWAQSNRIVCPQMDTMFLVTNVQYSYLAPVWFGNMHLTGETFPHLFPPW